MKREPHRLTDAQVVALRELRAEGVAVVDLAERFDVSQAHVTNIIRGHRRAKAGGPIQTTRQYHRRARRQ